jgi:ribokinase
VQDVVRPGQTISSTKIERRGGGKGANQAVAVARASGAVSLVGAVGEDGTWLVRDLEGRGVSTANISVVQVCPVLPLDACAIRTIWR